MNLLRITLTTTFLLLIQCSLLAQIMVVTVTNDDDRGEVRDAECNGVIEVLGLGDSGPFTVTILDENGDVAVNSDEEILEGIVLESDRGTILDLFWYDNQPFVRL